MRVTGWAAGVLVAAAVAMTIVSSRADGLAGLGEECGAWQVLLRAEKDVAALSVDSPSEIWSTKANRWRSAAGLFRTAATDPVMREVGDLGRASADLVLDWVEHRELWQRQRFNLTARGMTVFERAFSQPWKSVAPVDTTSAIIRLEARCGATVRHQPADTRSLFADYDVVALNTRTERIDRVTGPNTTLPTRFRGPVGFMAAFDATRVITIRSGNVSLVDPDAPDAVMQWPTEDEGWWCVANVAGRPFATIYESAGVLEQYVDDGTILSWPGLSTGFRSCVVGPKGDLLVSAYRSDQMHQSVWVAAGDGAVPKLLYRRVGCTSLAVAARRSPTDDAVIHVSCTSIAESGIYVVGPNGDATQIHRGRVAVPNPTPDGRWILFAEGGPSFEKVDLWALDRQNGNAVARIAVGHTAPVVFARSGV